MPYPYACSYCGYSAGRRLKHCPACELRDSYVEVSPEKTEGWVMLNPGSQAGEPTPQTRHLTGLVDLDRVLGGGLVSDSITLLGGNPGIGKSTLVLQMAHAFLLKQPKSRILYVSGEESISQIRDRASRLKIDSPVFLSTETHLESVLSLVGEIKPRIIFMDSLQTFFTSDADSPAGSMRQMREVAACLMGLAKTSDIAIVLVSHVTKKGSIAGPKAVEHFVDTVLCFDLEASASRRLSASKNRFGSTQEVARFEMTEYGLLPLSE